MPVCSRFYLLQQTSGQAIHPGPLMAEGPWLDVEVHVPKALEQLLIQQGSPVPAPARGKALIDTGASISAVDNSIITSLGVQPVGVIPVHTPSGSTQQSQYPVRFSFPGSGLPDLSVQQAIGSILQAQGIIALIGRDALASVILVYNGPGGNITLAI